jgi:hypothetical protein
MIRTISNIHHDGTLYTEGQEILGLTDEQAAALIAAGAAESAPEPEPDPAPDPAPEQKPAKPAKPTGGAD